MPAYISSGVNPNYKISDGENVSGGHDNVFGGRHKESNNDLSGGINRETRRGVKILRCVDVVNNIGPGGSDHVGSGSGSGGINANLPHERQGSRKRKAESDMLIDALHQGFLPPRRRQ